MSISLEPLKVTSPPLHRFWFKIYTPEQWYAVMHECHRLYGKNWRTKRNVLKRFKKANNLSAGLRQWMFRNISQDVWFEVPDSNFATWIAIKYSIEVASEVKHSSGK